jgi:hypothetical protein
MTWLWITVFVVACTAPLAGYIYFIEIRQSADESPSRDDDQRIGGRL